MKLLFLILIGLNSRADVTPLEDLQNRQLEMQNSIRQNVQDLRNTSSATPKGFPDYENFKSDFQGKAEALLLSYPAGFEKSVLNPLRAQIVKYKTIQASTQYSAAEKVFLLKDLHREISRVGAIKSEAFNQEHLRAWVQLLGLPVEYVGEVALRSERRSYYDESRAVVSLFTGEAAYCPNLAYGYSESNSNNPYPAGLGHYRHLWKAPLNKELEACLVPAYFSFFSGCFSRGCQNYAYKYLKKFIEVGERVDREFRFQFDLDAAEIILPYSGKKNFFTRYHNQLDKAFTYMSEMDLDFSISPNSFQLLLDLVKLINTCDSQASVKYQEFCTAEPYLCRLSYFRDNLKTWIKPTQQQCLPKP